jgi:sulfate adenylyltransferase
MSDGLIKPHGGRLINRVLAAEAREEAIARADSLKRIALNARTISDLELIAVGAFSPLEGVMGRQDYQSVVDDL